MTDHQPPTVDRGVVVPRRPTANMLREAVKYWQSLPGQTSFANLDKGTEDTLIGKALFTWEAMLSAAPAQPPAALDEAVGLLRWARDNLHMLAESNDEKTDAIDAFLANLEPSQ